MQLWVDDYIKRNRGMKRKKEAAVCVLEKRREVRGNGGGDYKQRRYCI